MLEWLRSNADLVGILAGALLLLAVLLLVLWLVAAARHRREARRRVEAEREMLALEFEVAEQAERMRILRELHEAAVLSVSATVRQAQGARLSAATDAAAAARAAGAIEEAARSTLGDLRRVVAVLGEGTATTPPSTGLDTLPELFELYREAGLQLTVEETGERFEVKRAAELAIYGILQEALENCLRYGGPGTPVRVGMTWTADGVRLLIEDEGARTTADRSGSSGGYTTADDLSALAFDPAGPGIAGMKERAALFGGVFHAEATAGVGFSVSVVFPALKYHNGIHGVNLSDDAGAATS